MRQRPFPWRHMVSALVLALCFAPLSAAAETGSAIEQRVYVETTVDSDRDGRPDRVALDIAQPSGTAKVPVIFEHSPYRSGLGPVPFHPVNVDRLPQEGLFPAAADTAEGPVVRKAAPDLPARLDDYFVPRGYAVVLGHSIGTRGLPGLPDERRPAGDAVHQGGDRLAQRSRAGL